MQIIESHNNSSDNHDMISPSQSPIEDHDFLIQGESPMKQMKLHQNMVES